MNICFLLPGVTTNPVGGYKVVYEYANRFSSVGHGCEVRYLDLLSKPTIKAAAKRKLRRLLAGAPPLGPDWFELSGPVALREIKGGRAGDLHGFDVVVATSWQTAEVLGMSDYPHEHSAYLIQGHETWSGDPRRVEATYSLPFQPVVISSWLESLVAELVARPPERVLNGVDHDVFHVSSSVHKRDERIAFLWNSDPNKDSGVMLEALNMAKMTLPELQATVVCGDRFAPDFPDWIETLTHLNPSQMAEVFNRATIFLSASRSEGWGMPATEAMACGAALITSDIPGVTDYAIPGKNCLTFPVGDTVALATAILLLVRDPAWRRTLAAEGLETVELLNWDTSAEQFLGILTGVAR